MEGQEETLQPKTLIKIGDTLLDLRQRSVTVNGNHVNLTRREFDMLCLMAKHPGWAYTKEQLLEAAWGNTADSNHHAVETMIYWLRRKLRSSANVKIQTLVGYGYRLNIEQD